MTDTAEYWNDIKDHFRNRSSKRVFIHYKGLNCGHFHVKETIKMKDVDCYACKELIKKSLEQ